MVATFCILFITILAFLSNRLRPDFVAICSAVALFLFGVLGTREAFSGFSDPTVVMIAGLLVVSSGLSLSGVTQWLCQYLLKLSGESELRVMLILMLGAAVLSGFVSNTGVVAMLLPAAILIGRELGISPAKLLIPLAFASNTGGLLTMIGTPPNVVVVNALEKQGLKPFAFFEFALIGIPLLLVLILYMTTVGRRLLPNHREDKNRGRGPELPDLVKTYGLDYSLFQVTMNEGSVCIGKMLGDLSLGKSHNVDVIFIDRSSGKTVDLPSSNTVLQDGDTLLVRSDEKDISRAARALNWTFLHPMKDSSFANKARSAPIDFVEVIIPPRSSVIGKTIGEIRNRSRDVIQVVALRRGMNSLDHFASTPLAAGDMLLLRASSGSLAATEMNPEDYLLLSHRPAEVRELDKKGYFALGILTVMIVLMLFRLVPAAMAAVIAACLMIVTRCLSLPQAYRKMNWESVVLIAAMISMSVALQKTGGAEFLALTLVGTLGQLNPIWLLAGVFLITSGFSQVMSNTATSILIVPIVLRATAELNLSPQSFLIGVAVAASTAFLTPIGTTTNVMVMTPGKYSFADYIRCGAPLVLMFLILSLILIPLLWPFSSV